MHRSFWLVERSFGSLVPAMFNRASCGLVITDLTSVDWSSVCVMSHSLFASSLSLSLYIYIYIYIYNSKLFYYKQSSCIFRKIQNIGETELSEQKNQCFIGERFHISFSYKYIYVQYIYSIIVYIWYIYDIYLVHIYMQRY